MPSKVRSRKPGSMCKVSFPTTQHHVGKVACAVEIEPEATNPGESPAVSKHTCQGGNECQYDRVALEIMQQCAESNMGSEFP